MLPKGQMCLASGSATKIVSLKARIEGVASHFR